MTIREVPIATLLPTVLLVAVDLYSFFGGWDHFCGLQMNQDEFSFYRVYVWKDMLFLFVPEFL